MTQSNPSSTDPSPSTILLRQIYTQTIQRLAGANCVAEMATRSDSSFDYVIAIGKAAPSMLSGYLTKKSPQAALLISAPDYVGDQQFDTCVKVVLSTHPLPSEQSLQAGEQLLSFIAGISPTASVLFLISGGSSAMVEVLKDGVTLKDLQGLNQWLLAHSIPITSMNALRQRISRIKGGGLCAFLKPTLYCEAWYVSDVIDDDPAVIGSGLLKQSGVSPSIGIPIPEWLRPRLTENASERAPCKVQHHILASATLARNLVCQQLPSTLSAHIHDDYLGGEVSQVALDLIRKLRSLATGVHIWSGEPLVVLPENPGRGGRMTALASYVAQHLAVMPQGENWTVLCASTDGIDGNARAAGAIVDCETFRRLASQGVDLQEYLEGADSASCLEKVAALIPSFSSGTNVTDLIIALKMA